MTDGIAWLVQDICLPSLGLPKGRPVILDVGRRMWFRYTYKYIHKYVYMAATNNYTERVKRRTKDWRHKLDIENKWCLPAEAEAETKTETKTDCNWNWNLSLKVSFEFLRNANVHHIGIHNDNDKDKAQGRCRNCCCWGVPEKWNPLSLLFWLQLQQILFTAINN